MAHTFDKCNSCNFIIPRMKNKTVIHIIKEHDDKPKDPKGTLSV
jgi:hypothetical protein